MLSEEKLNWFNKEHMKKLSPEIIEKEILERLPKNIPNPKFLVPVIFERISKWSDVDDMVARGELDFFFKAPEINETKKEKLIYKNTSLEKTAQNIKQAIQALGDLDANNFTAENVKSALTAIADNLESRGELLHPVRFALSGLDKSPDPFTIASILGKNETLARLQKAIS